MRFKNRYLKWPSREKLLACKKGKKLRNSLTKERRRLILKRLQKTESWIVKSFRVQSNLSFHQKASFIETDNKIIEDKSELAKTFNSHYINIVKSTTGKHPTKLETLGNRINEKRNCCN